MDLLLLIRWSIFDTLLCVNQVKFPHMVCFFSTHRLQYIAQYIQFEKLNFLMIMISNLKK